MISGLIKGFNDLKDCGFIDRFPKIIGVQSSIAIISVHLELVFLEMIIELKTIADSISGKFTKMLDI